jgi:hypothetical protein
MELRQHAAVAVVVKVTRQLAQAVRVAAALLVPLAMLHLGPPTPAAVVVVRRP